MSKKPRDPWLDLEIISSLKRTLCAAILIRAEKTSAKGGSVIPRITVVAAVALAFLTGRPELMDVFVGGP